MKIRTLILALLICGGIYGQTTVIGVNSGGGITNDTVSLQSLVYTNNQEEFYHTVSKDIDLTIDANTLLISAQSNKYVVISRIKMVVLNSYTKGFGTKVPTISIGTNSSTYNNILNSYRLAVPIANKIYDVDTITSKKSISNVYLNVDTASNYAGFKIKLLINYSVINDTTTAPFVESAETNALVSRFITPLTQAQLRLVDSCMVMLKDSGIYAKADLLYFYCLADTQQCFQNWKENAYNIHRQSGIITHITGSGVSGNGAAYLNTFYNPSTNATNATPTNITMAAWSKTEVNSTYAIMGVGDGTNSYLMFPRAAGNFYYNCGTGSSSSANTSSIGLFSYTKTGTGSNQVVGYKNGVSQGLKTNAGSTFPNRTVYVHGYNLSGSGNSAYEGIISMSIVSSGLTSDEQRGLYNIANWFINRCGDAF